MEPMRAVQIVNRLGRSRKMQEGTVGQLPWCARTVSLVMRLGRQPGVDTHVARMTAGRQVPPSGTSQTCERPLPCARKSRGVSLADCGRRECYAVGATPRGQEFLGAGERFSHQASGGIRLSRLSCRSRQSW